MAGRSKWILLSYRLPREPSTPRISVWRKLRRLGVAQVLDGLVALPLDARNREHIEWLADEILEAGGEASLWLAEPVTAAQERDLARSMTDTVAEEYRALATAAAAAADEDPAGRRRTLARLRRELRRIASRDYFGSPEQHPAKQAIERLASALEAAPP